MLDGLTADAAVALDKSVCQAIVQELDLKAADMKPVKDFAAWAARTNYQACSFRNYLFGVVFRNYMA
jgi:hypothetical protein